MQTSNGTHLVPVPPQASFASRLVEGAKAVLTTPVFSRTARQGFAHPSGGGLGSFLSLFMNAGQLLPSTKHDYAKEVGDGMGSSVLAGPLNFLRRTFPEAPLIVERLDGETWKPDPKHELLRLWQRPNDFYNGREMVKSLVVDYAFGNGVLYKVRNQARKPINLWWIPRFMLTPKYASNGSSFIDYWEYTPGNGTYQIDPNDLVHCRNGIDPRDVRLGLSDLGALMREVGIDDQAANFMGAILRNLGIIGLVVSPKEKGQKASPEAIKETKEYLKRMFTGDKRGEALVHGAPVDVHLLQYQMQNLDVSWIRDVSEERVCAALGFPAAVVGFGTGLQQTKVGATMKEMRQLAWTGGIIPMQESIAEELTRSLLPEFEGGEDTGTVRVRFDTSKVRALWEDNNEKHTRVREDYKAKIIDRAEARRETGREEREEDKGVYFTGTPNAPAVPPVVPPAPDPDEPEPAKNKP